jgi:hypothetical protein
MEAQDGNLPPPYHNLFGAQAHCRVQWEQDRCHLMGDQFPRAHSRDYFNMVTSIRLGVNGDRRDWRAAIAVHPQTDGSNHVEIVP